MPMIIEYTITRHTYTISYKFNKSVEKEYATDGIWLIIQMVFMAYEN